MDGSGPGDPNTQREYPAPLGVWNDASVATCRPVPPDPFGACAGRPRLGAFDRSGPFGAGRADAGGFLGAGFFGIFLKRKARTYHRSDEYGLRLHREIPLGGRLVVNLQSSCLFSTVKGYPCAVVVAFLNGNGNSWPACGTDIPKWHMYKCCACRIGLRLTLATVAAGLLYNDVRAGLGTSACGSGRHRILALHALQ